MEVTVDSIENLMLEVTLEAGDCVSSVNVNSTKCSIGFTVYELTPWTRALLENLIVTQLLKIFSSFYGT
jgi:hypothetical protein